MKVALNGKVVNSFKGKNGEDQWIGVLVDDGDNRMSIVNMKATGKVEYKMGTELKGVPVSARVQFCNEL